ncbi:hypothetical protein [Burkholderia multivorans]|uniref:hypothetical protein n=1 Tax=Burkholderia multivorans TaxID=87883 RepID=UPI000CFECCDE|nr:hypothetical protein [Burkholderia multivorans]PRF93139.1 hypothetical protein C6Q23_05345 [Burkholderia multivorans]
MTKRIHQDYFKRETAEVAQFVDSLKDNATKGGTFDSAAAADFLATATSQNTGVKVPDTLQTVLDEAKGDDAAALVTRAVLDGVSVYEAQHGTPAPADVIELALHSAYATTEAARRKFSLDSATSAHHDQISLQPNRAVVAILAALGEAIPFAHYLPADIGSNEARLAIMTHQAGNTFGSYAQGALLDGVDSGDAYISSSRVHTSMPAAAGETTPGAVAGKITAIQATADTCDQNAAALKLLRGRSIVYVDGRVAAREVDSAGSGNSAVSGTIIVAGTSYAIGGTINTDTGVYALTTTPPLPATVPVVVEGFIDFERAPELTPTIISAVNTFSLFAKPWRVTTHQTIDSRTQMANELGLDPYSESVIAIQAQFANERHYDVLRKGVRLAALNTATFDLGAAQAHVYSGRFGVWPELAYPLSVVSQKMAEDTMNHGVTHLYVTKRVAAQFLGLPSTLFQPSGIAPRPGIYRLGRLFGQYDVYYTPKGLNETAASAQILAVGRATDVTRNPVVLGDAVPPTVIPLAVNADLRQGAGFYARNFTAVNPHDPSARGFALINVTNM